MSRFNVCWFVNADHFTNSLTGCFISTQSDHFKSFVDDLYSFFSEKETTKEELSNEELLEKYNWDLVCESPMEIEHQNTGEKAKGQAANFILFELKELYYGT